MPRSLPSSRSIAYLLALFLAVAAGQARAADSGFHFLRLPVSTRSAAMGDAGVALLAGPSAFHVNPAGLVEAVAGPRPTAPWGVAGEASLAHHEALGNLRQDAIVVDLERGNEALALTFNTLYSEDVELTDEVGNRLGSFGLSDLEGGVGYARRLSEAWRVGFTVAYARERIASSSAGTWMGGAGVAWSAAKIPGLSLGAALRHLGGSPRFTIDGRTGDPVSLPLTAQAGAGYRRGLGGRAFGALAADLRKARDEDPTGHLGLELSRAPVTLRVGSRLGTDLGHFTGGLGLEAGRFRFDYAFEPTGEVLGTSHRAELSARFGL